MDFIFHEMHDAVLARGTVPYAPYIMLLIKDILRDIDFSDDCNIVQKVKKPYKIKAKDKEVPYPTPSANAGFMKDARTSGARSHSQKAATQNLGKEIKKLSWYQKFILCRSVDDHKEAYQGYRERHELSHQNALILHHVSKTKGGQPKRSPPTPYKKWNKSKINYLALERHLTGFAAGVPTAPPPESGNDSDDGDNESDGTDDSFGGSESE